VHGRLAWLALPALVLASRPAGAGEVPTEDQIRAALDGPGFQAALAACLYTESLTLIIQVDRTGSARLAEWKPEELERFKVNCIASKVKHLSFPATEYRYKVSYEAFYPGTAQLMSRIEVFDLELRTWQELYKEARKKILKGGIMTGVGGLFMIGGTVGFSLLYAWRGGSEENKPWLALTMLAAVSGTVCLIFGTVHLSAGVSLRREAREKQKKSVSLLVSPGALTLSWY
jgi:hypothetical protein